MSMEFPATGSLVRRESPSHGLGVYTLLPIAAGSLVMEFGGDILSCKDLREGMRVLQVGEDQYIAEDLEADHIENYVNHCCSPNLGFTDGSLHLRALRDIAAGEELTWDYSTSINEPGWSFTCHCGAQGCRGQVRSYCDLTPAQRDQLRPIALAYLRNR